jgi:hypothetical protein
VLNYLSIIHLIQVLLRAFSSGIFPHNCRRQLARAAPDVPRRPRALL